MSIAKKKINWKEAAPFICAFLIPVFVMILIFIQRGIFPFGEMSFLRTDLYHQYAPFFQELKDKLSEGGSLLYSWDIGMGSNFAALYAYYLASPLNWLLVLCPRAYVIEFITYMIVFKIGASSFTMTYYLCRHNSKKDMGAAFFGIFYGLSGYMAAYSWNIMWLDCILLFPLIIWGLERLVKENKCFLYCITLALSILSNYYISIMVCIGVVLYFIVQMILTPMRGVDYLKRFGCFCLYSLLAGGLACAVLIPEVYALRMTASSNVTFPKTLESYFSIFDMIARHLVDVEVHIGLDHWPNIYCGVGILLFIPLYIMAKKISFKEKICYFMLILFFLLSFSLNLLNFIWHGFHYPNSLPARQSFIYIFLVLSMGYAGYRELRERSSKQIIGSIWIAVVFILLAEKLIDEDTKELFFNWHVFYLSLLFIAIYGGLAYAYRRGKIMKEALMAAALLALTVEATINTGITSVTTVNRTSYVKDDAATRSILSDIKEEEGSDFYRVEKLNQRTKNDGAWLGYPSVSTFSSTANANLTDFFKKVGLESSTNAYGYNGNSWFTHMLFGVSYSIASTEQEDHGLSSLYESKDGVYVYKNDYALPLGFMVPSNLNTTWQADSTNPIDNQMAFAQYTANVYGLYTFNPQTTATQNTTVAATTISYTIERDGYAYAFKTTTGPDTVQVTCGSELNQTFDNLNRGYLINLGYRQKGDIVTFTNVDDANKDKAMSINVYTLDAEQLGAVYEELSSQPMVIDSFDDTHVNAHVTASDDGLLLTTIPYEEGWTLKVDGQEVTPEVFADAFISIPLTAGSHTLEFSYTPAGMQLGILLSGISLIVFLALIALKLLIKNNDSQPPQGRLPAAGDTDSISVLSSTISETNGSGRTGSGTPPSEEERLRQELEVISRLDSSGAGRNDPMPSKPSQDDDLFYETPLDDISEDTTKEDMKK
ncbi:MAG: YfhO family protein [Lachnospiraceae bacterium]